MNVFLAGGTGIIGLRALPALAAAGHSVTVVARTPDKADVVRSLGGQPVAVDLFDADAVTAAVTAAVAADSNSTEGASGHDAGGGDAGGGDGGGGDAGGHDVVINLATNIPPFSRAALPSAWAMNDRLRTEASANLVDAALAAGASRYIQESICFAYRDNGADWIDEDHPVDHVGPFAGAAHAEAAAQRFTESGGTGVVLRFAQFYAPDSSHTRTFNALIRRRINPLMGDPAQYTSFVHADDAGAAVVAALDAAAGIYNIADDEPLTKAEAGRVIADALGAKPPWSMPKLMRTASPKSAKLLMRSQRISHDRFTAATGWTPTHPSIRDAWSAEMT